MNKKIWKKILILFIGIGILGLIVVLGINGYVKNSVKDRILAPEEVVDLENVDCILVLGCLVRDGGQPSHMLEDRLTRGVELYKLDIDTKLLMSGDHGQADYDEVNVMKQFAIDEGVSSEDVFMDHAGFSTYESVYRARDIFEADKIIIVTQEYHLYRALYVAEQLGVEAYGVSADYRTYYGQTMRDFREILARNKDFVTSMIKPEPTYLGESIPISGNGDVTNDKE